MAGTEGSIARGTGIVLDPVVTVKAEKIDPIVVRKWGCKSEPETVSASPGMNTGG